MIRPFVTGASGFVGRHLLRSLTARGVAPRTHSSADGDIATAALDLSGCTHLLHLAAKAFVPDSWADPREFYRVNVQGTINVLEQCRLNKVPVTIVSSYVYGEPRELPISEDHPLAPYNPYAHSKILAEEAARAYSRFFGLEVTIIRPFNIYGPGQDSRYLIPLLVRQALDAEAKRFEVADARPRRDYLFVDDLIDLLWATMQSPSAATVNAGSGHSHSIQDVTNHLNENLETPKPLHSRGEMRPTEVLDVVADISRARSQFGWEPRVSLRDGLRRMMQEQERGS